MSDKLLEVLVGLSDVMTTV